MGSRGLIRNHPENETADQMELLVYSILPRLYCREKVDHHLLLELQPAMPVILECQVRSSAAEMRGALLVGVSGRIRC